MSQENVETIKKLFSAIEARDLETYLAVSHPDVVIREPSSLPYGGDYRGLEGVERHAVGWLRTWGNLQSEAERKLNATFHDVGDAVIARWSLRARLPDGAETFDTPMVGVYRLREGKLVDTQMFYADTGAVLQFLEQATRT